MEKVGAYGINPFNIRTSEISDTNHSYQRCVFFLSMHIVLVSMVFRDFVSIWPAVNT